MIHPLPPHRHIATTTYVTQKIAIVIYSNVTTEALSRTYRALGFAAELVAASDDVAIDFDGDGSATLAAVLDPKHDLYRSWRRVATALRGVCGYCAKAYGVRESLIPAGIPMLSEDHGHASLRALLGEGRQFITF